MGSIMGSQKIMGSDYGSNISDTILLKQLYPHGLPGKDHLLLYFI
jgi:hypothetical protein